MRRQAKKRSILKNVYAKIAVCFGIAILSIVAYVIFKSSDVKKWNDKIYTGVYINDVDVSGKTQEEALKLITDEYLEKLQNKKLSIVVGDKTISYKYLDLAAKYNFEEAVDEAINFGKDKNIIKKIMLINGDFKHDILLKLIYDDDKICEIEESIKNQVNVEPKNAKIAIHKGNIDITPEESGYKVDDEEIHEKIQNALTEQLDKDPNVELDLYEEKASISADELRKIKEKPMSTFTTSYGGSNKDRSYNIALVTSLVDGTVLMPGEEFSYSEISQKGRGKYKMGTAYVNDKPVPSEGGGICQGTTTLYRAVMRANIRSTERHNHSLPVSYVPLGLDATIAWGYLDYKFKNPYDFPIYIEGITENKTVTFNIYGDPSVLGDKTYDMISEVNGKEAKSYQVTYENGQEIEREFISKDIYK